MGDHLGTGYQWQEQYFDQKEYLLGDSAFSASAVMIPAFKKGHNSNLSEEWRYFNNIVLGFSRHGFNDFEGFEG